MLTLTYQLRGNWFKWIDYRKLWDVGQCMKGMNQSPIDIIPRIATSENSNGSILLQSNYNLLSRVHFTFYHHNSYKIEKIAPDQGFVITSKAGDMYRWNLNNVHFHIPSEHTINGERYDMEMHFIHDKDKQFLRQNKMKDRDPKREALVMGVFFKVGNNIHEGKELEYIKLHNKKKFDFDISKFLNIKKGYYNYEGSLTTPKCDEIVEWIVFKDPIIISRELYQKIFNWVNHSYPIGNARPIYPLNGRRIFKRNLF